MQKQSPGSGAPRNQRQWQTIAALFILLVFVSAGCGAPGEPLPPSPPIPDDVTDLAGHQAGDGVLLVFTLPTKSTLGDKLPEIPTFEILRGSIKSDGSVDEKSLHVADTIPGAMMATYSQRGKVEFLDPISPEEARLHPGESVVYVVRARVTDKKTSANSNAVVLRLFSVPERIQHLEARVTEGGVELNWTAPQRTSGGEPLSQVSEYHVYRSEIEPDSLDMAARDLHKAKWKSPLLQIAATSALEYRDSGFDYGKTYVYLVRSVFTPGEKPLESSDSPAAIVTPKDTFPPEAPQGVVAAVLPGAAAGTFVVDLSWSISSENDLAGYRAYRSEKPDVRGLLLTPELLPTPAYRDAAVRSDGHYWYTVTAVDHAGNESAPSAPVAVDLTASSQ
jgi:hypothetical protein